METYRKRYYLEDSLAISYNTKYTHTIQQSCPWYFSKEAENVYLHKNLHTSVAALFTIVKTWKQLRCPSGGKQINKPWYLQTMGYCSFGSKAIKPWRHFKYILLSGRSSNISPPTKPESAYCIALCSDLWFHWGLSPSTISLSLSKS